MFEEPLQIRLGAVPFAELQVEEGAPEAFLGIAGIESEKDVDVTDRTLEVFLFDGDGLEVVEHAPDDVPGRGGGEFGGRFPESGGGEKGVGVLQFHGGASLERINDSALIAFLITSHEVPGQAESVQFGSHPASQLHHQQGEGDGNAFPIVDHLVEVAIGPAVVVQAAPVEAVVVEQIGADRPDFPIVGGLLGQGGGNLPRHAFDLLEVGLHVDLGVVQPGEEKGGAEQAVLGAGLQGSRDLPRDRAAMEERGLLLEGGSDGAQFFRLGIQEGAGQFR